MTPRTVWFISESGAVAVKQARIYVDLPVISRGFETAAGIRGLNEIESKTSENKKIQKIRTI